MNKIRLCFRDRGGVALLLFCVGILFYGLNYYTPLFADDFSYSFSMYNGEKISGFKEIILSLYAHYYSWSSRVVVHFFAQLFCWIGKGWFNLVNTMVFLTFGVLIFYHGVNRRLKDGLSLLLFIYCSLFLYVPAFGESFLWLVGSSNYLFGITLALAFLLPYRFSANRDVVIKNAESVFLLLLKLAGMSILGILAGWTNENTSVALMVIVLGFLLYYKYQKKGIVPWMAGGWIGTISGCVLHLVSPGVKQRLHDIGKVNFAGIIKNIVYLSSDFIEYCSMFVVILAVTGFFYVDSKRGEKLTEELIREELGKFFVPLIYFVGFLGSMYSLIVSPTIPKRVWSIIFAFLLVAVLAFYTEVFSRQEISSRNDLKNFKTLKIVVMTCFAVICFCTYAKVCAGLRSVAIQNDKRIEMIEECISRKQDVAYIPAIRHLSRISRYSYFGTSGDLGNDSEDWKNVAMAKYYGIPKIIVDPAVSQ